MSINIPTSNKQKNVIKFDMPRGIDEHVTLRYMFVIV